MLNVTVIHNAKMTRRKECIMRSIALGLLDVAPPSRAVLERMAWESTPFSPTEQEAPPPALLQVCSQDARPWPHACVS